MKYSDWQSRVELRPALVRAGQASLLLGSGVLVADFVEAGWLRPIVSGHRMVLYSYKDLELCVAKLEAGEDPAPDGRTDRPRDRGETFSGLFPEAEPSFAGQLRSMVVLRPLLLRPDQAAAFLGSVELLDEFRAAGWLTAVVSRNRLTLYSVRHLELCVLRLEAGQRPCKVSCSTAAPDSALTDSVPPATSAPLASPAAAPPPVGLPGAVVPGTRRSTRRPVPALA